MFRSVICFRGARPAREVVSMTAMSSRTLSSAILLLGALAIAACNNDPGIQQAGGGNGGNGSGGSGGSGSGNGGNGGNGGSHGGAGGAPDRPGGTAGVSGG